MAVARELIGRLENQAWTKAVRPGSMQQILLDSLVKEPQLSEGTTSVFPAFAAATQESKSRGRESRYPDSGCMPTALAREGRSDSPKAGGQKISEHRT